MSGKRVKVNFNAVNCMGCVVWVLCSILLIFILTHIAPIWHDLSKIVGS